MSEIEQTAVPYLDLTIQFRRLETEWLGSIRDTGANGTFIMGPNVRAFEREFADYVGARYAIAVANGTDALVLSLRALDIGPGDEVITTPYTFFASAEVVTLVGATPVFVDIDPRDFNLAVDQIAARITPRTRAILPVHLFGCPVDLTALMEVVEDGDIKVIEDCAQAFGADHRGRRVGAWGDLGCFSFYPTKVLGCYGDGGMVTTSDPDLAERVRHLRNHGASAPFLHDTIGYNSRLDEIQAALLRIKLRTIDEAIEGRRRVAAAYTERLQSTAVVRPRAPEHGSHVYNLYTVRVPHRDRVRQSLLDAAIGCSVCYPLPLHLQEVYRELCYRRGDLPVSEQAAAECVSLPIFPELEDAQIDRVCEVVSGSL